MLIKDCDISDLAFDLSMLKLILGAKLKIISALISSTTRSFYIIAVYIYYT